MPDFKYENEKYALVKAALSAREKSYSPYSSFAVGAALLTDGNEIFTGANIESASYTPTICAERVAITSAVAKGYKKGDFKEINIMLPFGKIGTPCFACRQVILEFFDENDIVRCYSTSGEYKEYTVKELCPYPFGVEDLK